MLFEGDVINYSLDAYGGHNTQVLATILSVNEYTITIKAMEDWPYPFHNWGNIVKVSPDYIINHVYTIAPKTPSRNE
jgi:hypothetical protein